MTDLIDSYTLNLEARRRQVTGLRRAVYEMEYRRVCGYEQATMDRFGGAVVVTSEADRAALQGNAHSVAVLPNGVDADKFAFGEPANREPATLIFTGNMSYHPNIEAVQWFVAEVWQKLREKYSSLRFQIVGTSPTPAVKALGDVPGVEVLGRVPDVTTFLHRATLAVCPMRSGSGIQNKMLEAMSAGAPVVATSIANRGVGATDGRDVVVADEPADFANAVSALMGSPSRRAEQALHARRLIESAFDWNQHAARLVEVYDGARRRHARSVDVATETNNLEALIPAMDRPRAK